MLHQRLQRLVEQRRAARAKEARRLTLCTARRRVLERSAPHLGTQPEGLPGRGEPRQYCGTRICHVDIGKWRSVLGGACRVECKDRDERRYVQAHGASCAGRCTRCAATRRHARRAAALPDVRRSVLGPQRLADQPGRRPRPPTARLKARQEVEHRHTGRHAVASK